MEIMTFLNQPRRRIDTDSSLAQVLTILLMFRIIQASTKMEIIVANVVIATSRTKSMQLL